MYRINKHDNRIYPLEPRKFSDLGFRERDHLQEWLANYPEALEETGLLIIQKEFAGFDETRERLDLLALDKVSQRLSLKRHIYHYVYSKLK